MYISPIPVYLGGGHGRRAPWDEGQGLSALMPQLFLGEELGPLLLGDLKRVALLPGAQVGSSCL